MSTYSFTDLSRREILQCSATLASFGAMCLVAPALGQEPLRRTPDQVLGPFYPITEAFPETGDLTKLAGRKGRAEGQVLYVTGRVVNLKGEPVRNAKVELWQANTHGRYTHPSDSNPAPLDPNFDGNAVLSTDSEGQYRFKTIKPGAYPGGGGIRPPHIHFQVSGKQDRFVTQMYFENEPHNDTDRFLQTAGRRELLITKLLNPVENMEPDAKLVVFDMVLLRG
jgi:protocatechuate 3,4-dioxygenase beta subunit